MKNVLEFKEKILLRVKYFFTVTPTLESWATSSHINLETVGMWLVKELKLEQEWWVCVRVSACSLSLTHSGLAAPRMRYACSSYRDQIQHSHRCWSDACKGGVIWPNFRQEREHICKTAEPHVLSTDWIHSEVMQNETLEKNFGTYWHIRCQKGKKRSHSALSFLEM